MSSEFFIDYKQRLKILIKKYLDASASLERKSDLIKILELLDQYNFENRLKMKGLLSRTIIDSLELDYSLGEEIIKFDNSIN